MNIYALTELPPQNRHIGWSVCYAFQDTLATTCDPYFLHPQVHRIRRNKLRRLWQRISKTWYTLDRLPTLGNAPNVLLMIGHSSHFLSSIFTLGSLLDQFDLRIAYLLDGFDPKALRSQALSHINHLFVVSAEMVDAVQAIHSIDTSFLPLGVNTFRFEQQAQRSIDVMGYGRTNKAVHQCLQKHFNQSYSDRLYFHSTFDHGTVTDPQEHITLHNRLLSRSKVSLCFEVSDVPRFQGQSPLVYRWLEGWAAGAAIVGKRPFGKGTDQLLDWPDSTFEIPDSPEDWIPFFEELLANDSLLAKVSARNTLECRLRHDWRYRLQSIFQQFNLPIPEKLAADITQLQAITQPVGARETPLSMGAEPRQSEVV
ncbi:MULTISPECIES: glycosyltransferase [unclassified Leptolyngbya]|uniref:glycosyltransferase n=1 Tax=unclassified Leptolyngbya TaxID=2650499 RepID=UPI001687E3E6|nr:MULTISPECIES: glycosyltransferase [unclassified Leptolyngbya]MBD1909692.1 glycosyltransferase family 1 protein [Leptolyngbya sp. FACHB-8]MBD2157531.1 glycosyltransferase family 1 protein [Leptolyngbya sp. FACHB-16]